ncbi:hypothetical protein [Flavobacterium psychrotrophum]|uniref:hypothetical protein n=1 Tax=Flavobacterium psychrotrophum TaxID=2294119 RepID=UPI000E3213A7|nr:hypothetical protein [Flavobacterium psychrotrophum]
MKTKFINTVLFAFISLGNLFAQDVTTVRANNSDISDNLDLQAVASIFGDSRDLEDFERRLNDPDTQISNLDLNGDNRVDYLRVVELTQNNVHVIVLQAVLGVDNFQDVATIEIERDRHNNVSVQVVGDVYMYGPNYIYEPVYVTRPALFGLFWVNTYRPYYSPWYWGYYPTYYNYWEPYPVYRYRNHVHVHINNRNTYNYNTGGRSRRAANLYAPRRSNYYEKQNPGRSFTNRNQNVANRHELEQSRSNSGTRGGSRGTVSNGSRSNEGLNNSRGTRDVNTKPTRSSFSNSSNTDTPSRATTRPSRSFDNGNARNNTSIRTSTEPSRSVNTPVRTVNEPTRSLNNAPVRTSTEPARQYSAPVRQQSTEPARQYSAPVRQQSAPQQIQTPRQSAPVQMQSTPRQSAPAQMQNAPATRQSTPSMSPRGGGNNGGGGSRRG